MNNSSSGAEGRRQAYLAALGLPLWTSRQPLPGALPGAALEVAFYFADEAEPAPVAAVEAAPARGTEPMPVRATPAVHPGQDAVAPAPGAAAGTAATETPRLACRVQALMPGWSALIDLGEAPDLSAQEHRLLANIVTALGGDPMAMPAGEQLRWPLNRNPRLDHGVGAMADWLAHALRLPPGRCIVFGEVLADHVRRALPQQAMLVAPGLAELLDAPAAKRSLWQSLHG